MDLLPNKFMGSDYVYYNLEISSTVPNTNKLGIFNINRTDIIIDNPSEYSLAVVDFSIPLFSIPLFIFEVDKYIFYLEFNGRRLQTFLQYVSESNNSFISYSVYSYQSFIQSMNDALKVLYDQMILLEPSFLATEQPFVTLKNNLISINIEDFYYLNNCFIYSNDPLYGYLRNINIFFIDNLLIKYLYNNHMPSYLRNGNLFYYLEQEVQSIENWNTLDRILLETSTIPVSSEQIGAENNLQINILGDYVRIPSPNRPIFYDFISRGPIRLVDLNSSYPQSSIDVIVRWFSNSGSTGIVVIPYLQRLYIKIAFVRNTYQNQLNITDIEGLTFDG